LLESPSQKYVSPYDLAMIHVGSANTTKPSPRLIGPSKSARYGWAT